VPRIEEEEKNTRARRRSRWGGKKESQRGGYRKTRGEDLSVKKDGDDTGQKSPLGRKVAGGLEKGNATQCHIQGEGGTRGCEEKWGRPDRGYGFSRRTGGAGVARTIWGDSLTEGGADSGIYFIGHVEGKRILGEGTLGKRL